MSQLTNKEPTPEDYAFSCFEDYVKYQWGEYIVAPHHMSIIDHLEKVEAGEIKRLMIFMPPRSGKTMLVSEFFPAWYLGRNPSDQIIATTYSFDRAGDVGRKVRNQLNESAHQLIFPGCKISPDSKGANKLNTLQGGVYYSVGTGGAIVGRGANLFIIDDPVKSREDAESELQQGKMIDWFRSVAYTRLMTKNAIVIVMTRWHYNDLAGWLLEEKKDDGWVVLKYPAIAEKNDILGRKRGEPLWPEKYPLEILENIRSVIDSREWNAQYQQRPTAEEGGKIKYEWIQHFNDKDLIACHVAARLGASPKLRIKNKEGTEFVKFKKIVCSWDTAFKEKQLNDPSACTVWAIAENGYYLLEVFNKRVNFPDLVSAAIRLYNKYRKFGYGEVSVLIEDRASGQSLIQELKRKTRIPVIPIKTDANKIIRLEEVEVVFESEMVHIPKNARWRYDYETQLTRFPYDKHDDMVDSTSQFLRWASRPRYIPGLNAKFWK